MYVSVYVSPTCMVIEKVYMFTHGLMLVWKWLVLNCYETHISIMSFSSIINRWRISWILQLSWVLILSWITEWGTRQLHKWQWIMGNKSYQAASITHIQSIVTDYLLMVDITYMSYIEFQSATFSMWTILFAYEFIFSFYMKTCSRHTTLWA